MLSDMAQGLSAHSHLSLSPLTKHHTFGTGGWAVMLRRSRVAPAMRHLLWFTQPTATLLDLAGVAYVVDAASTGYTPSLY